MYDIKKILSEVMTLPVFDDQICLQTIKGCTDHFYGTGRLTENHPKENEFTEFLFDLPYINNILKEQKMFRSRILKLKSKTCLTLHTDPLVRKHIPIITNEKCFFVVENQIIRFPAAGNVYTLDARKMHCAVNASYDDRIHIVGCI